MVLVTGPQDDALEGMEDAPSNFVLRRAVQQLEVLSSGSLVGNLGLTAWRAQLIKLCSQATQLAGAQRGNENWNDPYKPSNWWFSI